MLSYIYEMTKGRWFSKKGFKQAAMGLKLQKIMWIFKEMVSFFNGLIMSLMLVK